MKKHVIGGFIIEETDDKILMKWEAGINSQMVECDNEGGGEDEDGKEDNQGDDKDSDNNSSVRHSIRHIDE